MLNDMLGTTVGSSQDGVYSTTAFGETDNDKVFYTGKPQIGELGYAFLFRNYRPDQGKWQTSDPLGYPDGWNNFAYVNSGVTGAVDIYGLAVYWCTRDLGGSPLGNHHFLTFIPDNPCDFSNYSGRVNMGNGEQGWTYGGFEDDGKIKSRRNNANDLQSIRELNDP